MMKKIICSVALPLTMAAGFAGSAAADVPPPPVNQNIGIPDGVFNNLVETNCRACHEDTSIVDPGTIPDRHHLLVGETVPELTAAPHGSPGELYECLSCHELVWNDQTYSYDFASFRDCLLCHQQIAGEASVHHLTQKAQQDDCKACHGPIDNPDDGHYIPSYDPSLVTPKTGLGSGPNGEGGCAFCHDAGVESASGIAVYTNMQTHHSTGLGLDSNKCSLCHDLLAADEAQVRQCQACHGVNSLHNIQVDAGGDGLVPGSEESYYGHIGNQEDCWGCHGFSAQAMAPYSGPVIPHISSLSGATLTAGADAALTISGAAFTNVVAGPAGPLELTSTIVLRASGGAETVLLPSAISQDTIEVTIPATMVPGSYALSAVKGTSASNKVNLSIIPAVTIASAACSNGVVAITGSGFSQYVEAAGSGTGVSLPASLVECSIDSWSDSKIIAQCGECDPSVSVDSVFGETSGAVSIRRAVSRKPATRR